MVLKLFSFITLFFSFGFVSTSLRAQNLIGSKLEMRQELKATRPTGGGWSLEQTSSGLIFHTDPNTCSFGPKLGGCTRMAAPSIKTEILVVSVSELTGQSFAELKNVPGFRLILEGPSYNLSNAKLIKWSEELNRGTESYALVSTVRFAPVQPH